MLNIKAVRKEAAALASNKRTSQIVVNQAEEDEEMQDQSEELAPVAQPQRQSIIDEIKKTQQQPAAAAPQVALHGFTDKQEITEIQTIVTKQLNGSIVGLPSKLTAGRGSGQTRVIVVSKDGGYKATSNLIEVVNQQWILDSLQAGSAVST